MANCNKQQLNITCGTDVVLHDRLIFDGETFDPNLSVGIAANLVSSLGKRTALDVQVVDDELLISVPWIDGTLPGCYGLDVTGSCNSKKWATYADSLIKYTKATRIGVSEVTVESDSYDITQEVGYRYSDSPVKYATATIDNNVGVPSVDVTYEHRVLGFEFHNMKGEPGVQGEQGIQGIPGESAVFDPTTGNISVIKQTTGDDTLSPMSQKAVANEISLKEGISSVTWTDSGGILVDTGEVNGNTKMAHSSYIDVSAYSELYVPVISTSDTMGYALFDGTKTFISGGAAPIIHQGVFDYIMVVTNGAKYLRLTAYASNKSYFPGYYPLVYGVKHVNTKVSTLSEEGGEMLVELPYYQTGEHNHGIDARDGEIYANTLTGLACSDYIDISDYEEISIPVLSTSYKVGYALYDDNKVYIEGGAASLVVTPLDFIYRRVRTNGAHYLRNTVPSFSGDYYKGYTLPVYGYSKLKDGVGRVVTNANFAKRNIRAVKVAEWMHAVITSKNNLVANNDYCLTSYISARHIASVRSLISKPISVNCYDEEYNLLGLWQNFGVSFTTLPVECAFVRMWFEQSDLSAADASIEIMMSVGDERFSSLEGKSVVTFGDSITWYDNRNYLNGKAEGDLVFGYQHYMRKAGMTTNNQGANGYESKRILNIVRSFTRFAQMDYMTLMTGANDERLYVNVGVVLPIGSTYDTNTYAGALQTIIEYALSINPRLKIVLFTPIKGWFYGDDPRMIRDDYVDAVKAIGKIYSIPVLDLHNLIGLNDLTRDIMINDPEPPENELYSLHPSNYGYERMASVILPFLADV